MILLSFIFILIAGFAKSKRDTYMKNLDFANSWKNKYKKDENGNLIINHKNLWYYLWLYKPSYVEKFPYSTTIFVNLTDNWHKWESININCIFISFLFLFPITKLNIIFIIILRIIYSIYFTIKFHKKNNYVL